MKFEILWWGRRGRCPVLAAAAGSLRLPGPERRLSRASCGLAPGPRRQVGVLWGLPR